jgi:hypothetical protein
MRTAFLVAVAVALAAAAAWALSGSKPAGSPYTVEVRDVAGVRGFTVVPEVHAAVPGCGVMPEVVVRANLMPEVVVYATEPVEVAGLMKSGSEVPN